MIARVLALAALSVTLLAIGPPVAAADAVDCATDQPSLAALACQSAEPVATADPAFSDAFVVPSRPVAQALAPATPCRQAEIVVYTAGDWYRLAQKLRANASPCAEYYISVPALTATRMPRSGEAARLRALGPQIHPMAEIHWGGWTTWVAANPGKTWYDAGVEARRQMALAGYDTALGDIWALNELPSGVRTGTGTLRQNVRDFVRGLYDGDGTDPTAGVVWTTGIGQATADTTTYKQNLRSWLKDAGFWADMQGRVRFWSQEVYASTLSWGVAGSTAVTRRDMLNDYLQHEMSLGAGTPEAYAAMKAFLEETYTPLANAAYWYASGFGYTLVPIAQMKAFVSSQVYALRNWSGRSPWRASDSFGFAWAQPATIAAPLTKEQLTAANGELADRLAAAIHDSDVVALPEQPVDEIGAGACGPDGSLCAGDVDNAVFNPAWQIFRVWNHPPLAVDTAVTTAEETAIAFKPVVSDIDKDALPVVVTGPEHGTITQVGATVTYTPALDFAGTDRFTFVGRDTELAESAVATATITVTPVNDAPLVTLAPAGPVAEGTPTPVAATATDVDGDALAITWAATLGTVTGTGADAVFTADDGPSSASVTVTVDDGHGGTATATIPIEVVNAPPLVDAGTAATTPWGIPLRLAGAVSDPGIADTTAGLAPAWDFGDGTTATGATVDHAYAAVGTYTATLTALDKDGGTTSDTVQVTVGARPTSLAYEGPAALPASGGQVSARLVDTAAGVPLAGRTLVFTAGFRRCEATTDTAGLARCSLGRLRLGPVPLVVKHAGDTLYEEARTSAAPVAYASTEGGAFVVGDLAATGAVTLWSPRWHDANPMSGGTAPARFHGWAGGASVLACGGSWVTRTGAAPDRDDVPRYVAVAVASTVTGARWTVQGTTVSVVVVRVAGHGDRSTHGRDRRHVGNGEITGTVVARIC